MAKFYGSLVGAAIQKGGFAGVSNFSKDGSDHVLIRDTVALSPANVVGDQVSLAVLRSSAFIDPSAVLWNDALGAGVTLNIGDVNYPAGLMNGAPVSAAGSGTLWRNFTPSRMAQPLWQALGYGVNPGGFLELLATITGAAPSAAGSLAWKLIGMNR